ncbi:hypothetical protein J2X36_004755 [Methylobacterium sp. BE186]|uniref:hypothetical protein n=1 Tax=Methylobacterium sp. BE186 TaxID=2817715 RepID=UPI002857B7D6|nr:hypothetical protein [Methylobacterium sp. BE186]MDR7039977.1 hypothetical protein [Methylobacterium sp. BE186]
MVGGGPQFRSLRAFGITPSLMGSERTSFLRGLPGSFESGGEADVPGLAHHGLTSLCCVYGSHHNGAALVTSCDEKWRGERSNARAPFRNVCVNPVGVEGAPFLDRSAVAISFHLAQSSGPRDGSIPGHQASFGENITIRGVAAYGHMSTTSGLLFT